MTGFSVLPTTESNVDIDLIKIISEKRFNFFIEYYNKLPDDPKSLDVIYYTRYLRMYLFEDDSIFSDFNDSKSMEKWQDIVNLISIEHYNTLYSIIKFLERDEQVSFLEMFLDTMIYSVDIYSLNAIFQRDYMIELLASTSKIKEVIYFYAGRSELFDVLYSFISNKKTRNVLYKTLSTIAQENIHTNMIHALSDEERIDIVSIKKKMVNISAVLMDIYFNGVKTDKIVKFEVIETESTEFTPLNNMFSLIHKFLNIGFISITSYLESFESIIQHWDKMVKEHEDNGDTYNASMASVQLNYFGGLFKKMRDLRTEGIIKNVHRFYASDTLYWLYSLNNIERQDITDNIINNYINYSLGVGIEEEVDGMRDKILIFYGDVDVRIFCDLTLKIINMKNNITSNIGIKCSFLDTINRRKFLGSVIPINIEFIETLVGLFNLMISNQETYEFSIDCFTIFRILSNNINFETYVSQNSSDAFNEFCHKILDTYHNCYTKKFELLKNMNSRQCGDEPEIIDFNKDKSALGCAYMCANTCVINSLIDIIIKHKPMAFLGIATRDKFVVSVLNILNELLGEKRGELKVEGFTPFNPIDKLYEIYNLFTKSYPIQEFRKSVINESRYLNFDLLFKMPRLLLKKNKLLERECYQFIAIVEELKKYHELENELDLDDIPEEFLDPIMGILINDPVMLPNSDTIMERDIIFRHVISEKNNPFNREELSIKDIENFNSLDEIKEKICEFNRKKSETLDKMR